jgi:hypothetical protein
METVAAFQSPRKRDVQGALTGAVGSNPCARSAHNAGRRNGARARGAIPGAHLASAGGSGDHPIPWSDPRSATVGHGLRSDRVMGATLARTTTRASEVAHMDTSQVCVR